MRVALWISGIKRASLSALLQFYGVLIVRFSRVSHPWSSKHGLAESEMSSTDGLSAVVSFCLNSEQVYLMPLKVLPGSRCAF